MNKIIVIGCCGSGKSYFSTKLSSKLDIPVYHMDNLFWKSNRECISREELTDKVISIINTDSWIIDGLYFSSLNIRLKACDTIFFLDFTLDECIKGIKNRNGKLRDDFPFLETQEDTNELIEYSKNIFDEQIGCLRDQINNIKDKNIIIFKNRDEVNKYLNNI